MAIAAASRSTCQRRVAVGAIAASYDCSNVVGIGYNGPARYLPHTCTDDPTMPGSCSCIHAELNALLKSPYDRGYLILVTTLAPCPRCARTILNTAVKKVAYIDPYRDEEGLWILRTHNIELQHVESIDYQYVTTTLTSSET